MQAIYLVTNWHVVTGLVPSTLLPIDANLPKPSVLRLFYKRRANEQRTTVNTWTLDIKLYDRGNPVWFEHSKRQHVDVVALKVPVAELGEFANLPINSIEQESRLKLYVGMDSFVLGFPEGISGPGKTPIWKRASIASEPDYDFRNVPGFIVDTATRSGMSGSPVIVRHSGIFKPHEEPQFRGDEILGTVSKFVGIYSGRYADDPMGVSLGMVWRSVVLDDILTGKTKGFSSWN